MRIVCDKVQFIVQMRKLDDAGNTVDEIATDPQKPLTLFSHQLGDLPAQVKEIVAQANAELGEPKPARRTRPKR